MSNASEMLHEYILYMVRNVVDKPEEVKVHISVSTKNIIIQIECNKSDLGKIIGKSGRTIGSLQILALAVKNTKFPDDNKKVSIEVLE